MKNLPKVMSNMYGAGGGMPGNSPTFKITMKEYEDMAIKVGDRVGIEVKKVDRQRSLKDQPFPIFSVIFSSYFSYLLLLLLDLFCLIFAI